MTYLILMFVFGLLLIYENIVSYLNRKDLIALVKQSQELLEHGMNKWDAERQQLLDRIQAPSFDHLKQAEVRIIKAQREEPAVKYELV